jgi:hypothetical protein
MIFPNGIACAAGILRRGQEKGSPVARTTGEPFDEPASRKTVALRVARGWAPASLRRSDGGQHRLSRRA